MKIETNWLSNKKIGIYCIENTVNSKRYIGSSTNIYQRLMRHRSDLKRGVHANPHLQSSFNKYSLSSFRCYILEECDDVLLEEREDYYMNLLNPDYNIREAFRYSIISDNTKLKISNTLKEKYISGELPVQGARKVSMYNLNGDFVRDWNSVQQAADGMNIGISSIRRVLKNIHKQCKGYQYFYSDEEYTVDKIETLNGRVKRKDSRSLG